MKFTVRDWVYVGVFGALWGAVEVGLGSIWHVVNVPFSGAMLSAIGIAVALIGRMFIPRPGSVLAIGLVTAFLKMFSLGGIVVNPMIGIVMESVFAEIVLTAMGQSRRLNYVTAGALATFWTLLHPFFTQGILAGEGMIKIYARTMDKGAKLLNLDPQAVLIVAVTLVVIHLSIGSVAGWVAWDAGGMVRGRLRPSVRMTKPA